MIDLNALLGMGGSLSMGTEVIVTNNLEGHNYTINARHTIYQTPEMTGNGRYILMDVVGGRTGNYISTSGFRVAGIKVDKAKTLNELENILEFCRDYDFECETGDINKSYKIFNIFKEIKSTKSDAEKIELISKYIG